MEILNILCKYGVLGVFITQTLNLAPAGNIFPYWEIDVLVLYSTGQYYEINDVCVYMKLKWQILLFRLDRSVSIFNIKCYNLKTVSEEANWLLFQSSNIWSTKNDNYVWTSKLNLSWKWWFNVFIKRLLERGEVKILKFSKVSSVQLTAQCIKV